jgi:hypothetical protein
MLLRLRKSQLREVRFCPNEWMNSISLDLCDEDVVFPGSSKGYAICRFAFRQMTPPASRGMLEKRRLKARGICASSNEVGTDAD